MINFASLFDWVHYFLAQHTLLSPIIYICLHILFALCVIPCSPMTILAGVLWGKWLGLCVSIIAGFSSCCATFCFSRYFLKNRIYQFLHKRYSKTDWFLARTKKHGWKFVASVQLNPIAPASVLGYLFGLTHIEFSIYALFVLIFMLPLQIVFVLLGDTFSNALVGTVSWILISLFLFGIVGCYVYKIINKSGRLERLDDI